MFQNWGSSLSPHVLFVQGCHHFFLFLLELPLKIWEPEKNILNWLVLQVFQGHPQIRSLHGKIFARLVKSSVNQYVACQPKTAGYIFLYIYMCMFCLIHTCITQTLSKLCCLGKNMVPCHNDILFCLWPFLGILIFLMSTPLPKGHTWESCGSMCTGPLNRCLNSSRSRAPPVKKMDWGYIGWPSGFQMI